MSYIFKILSEHAELTAENVMLSWQIEQYESLINDLMVYLCQEDILGRNYVSRYNSLLKIKRGKEDDK